LQLRGTAAEVSMRRELMHCPLRFATPWAYDAAERERGSLWVERSAEEFSLHEPIDASHGTQAVADALIDDASCDQQSFRREDIEGICANPLRDEPHPVIVAAVKRFGLVGLVACAVGTGLGRWWHSLVHRLH
jgi:hypothetical protein